MVYDASKIEVLEGLEAVRRRPAMYIGDVDQNGVNRLIAAAVGNAIGEVREGHATRVRVSLEGETLTVDEDGRGMPIEMHPRIRVSALQIIFTSLNAGCNCGCDQPLGHREGDPGLSLSVLNALSARLEVQTTRDGHRYQLRFEQGRVASPLEELGSTEQRGTRIAFALDRTIFGDAPTFDTPWLHQHIEELAADVPITLHTDH